MEVKAITDRQQIMGFLLLDPYLHLYELGNLHEKLFNRSKWFCAFDNGEIKALAMLHISGIEKNNILFLMENTNKAAANILLDEIKSSLPDSFYAHILHDTSIHLMPEFEINESVVYNKMKITGNILLDGSIRYPEYTYRINKNDFEAINEFLRKINPDTFFTAAMLKTGKYFMIRKNSDLIAMAGVHFYSEETSIAAIGNVVTAADFRGKGYGGSVTASLVCDLYKDVKYIGLNVKADNIPAIKAYEKMGFIYHSSYEKILVVKKK